MKKYITIIFAALLFIGCDDFLDIHPTGKVIAETGEEYRALLTDVYSKIPEDRGLTTLRSDEIKADYKSLTGLDYDSYFDIWNWTDYNRNPSSLYFGWRRYYHSCYIANYIIENNSTVRQTAKQFGISKSTVHKDVTERLMQINPTLATEARKVLDVNKSERHIRGGLATKDKYMRERYRHQHA